MAGNLDIVGTVGVDVVPVAPLFHDKLKAIALPAAQRVGEQAGRQFGDAMSRHITVAIPNAITNGGNAARNASTRAGNDNAGAFGRAFKARLEVAFKSLPKPEVRLGTTGFDADLARVRARMETLSGKRIGVDVDVAAAAAEIESIDAQLAALGSRSPNVQVRADIATARAELAAIQRQINDVDRDDVNIQVRANTAPAMASLLALSATLAGIALLPVIPIAAAGIGAIASAATVAAAGVGSLALAAIPAIKGVTSVIQAKTAAEKEAASATDNSAASSVKAAQQALQMATAQQSLAAAHRNAAKNIAQANRQVEDAERALGQAAARAMEQREQAAQNVARAERSLSDAKRQAQRAEEDLTRARQDAARQLEDLNDQLERGKLDERDATLRVREAQEELNRTQAEFDAGKATELQLQRAQLAYDQSVQAAEQQKKDYAQLQKDADAAKKAGVDGNEQVKTAAERLADAQRNVQDQTQAVAQAHRDAARAQAEAAETVATAQRAMSDAVQSAADAQVQAAESIASAERGVESARLSSIDTTAKAVSKADEYREALAKLTPEQRRLYDSLSGPNGLIPAFKEWSKELQPHTLPLFTRMVDGAKRSLPGLTPLVKNSATAVGDLMDRASADLKEPFWQRFKKGVAESAQPAIEGMGVAFGNVLKGMAGVVDAFLPHMDGISRKMQDITGRFADWGTGLRGSPEFENFLKYVKEHGPVVAEAFGDIGGALFDLAVALEPFSTVILEMLGLAAQGISYVAEEAPWAIQLLYGLWVATKLWNLAMAMNPIGAVIFGIALLALGLKYLWDNNEGFREAVTKAWNAIRDKTVEVWERYLRPFFDWFGGVVMWLWQHVIKPYIGFLIAYWTKVGEIFKWVWDHWLKPYIDFLIAYWTKVGEIFKWVWDHFLKPYIDFLIALWKQVGAVLKWVWDHFWYPIIGFIGALIVWWWNNIVKRYFGFVKDILWAVGGVFKWLYEKGVKPPLEWIADKVGWVWRKGIKPAFDKIKEGIKLVGDAFGDGKNAIKRNWNQIAGIAASPINFIIEWVYTKGIKAAFDKVAGFVGMDKLPDAPKLLDTDPKFARGGRVFGGTPGKDSVRAWLMPEEFVIRRDSARKLGYGTLEYLNRTGELPGDQKFADGGIVGAVSGAIDFTKNLVSSSVDFLANPGKVWDELLKPVLDKVREGVGSAPMGDVLMKYPPKMAGAVKDKLLSAAAGVFGGGRGGAAPVGSGEWALPVTAPLGTRFGVAGSMWSSGYHTGLDFPAMTGTPVRSVDDGRVSSVKSGGPYGNHILIDHGRGLSSLYAHLSQVAAKVGEDVIRGEGIGKVGATGNVTGPHLHLEARLGGRTVNPEAYLFDDGGYLPPGISLVANGTGKPEPIMTAQQWSDIRALKSGGASPVYNEVRVFMGDREITDIVRTEINTYDQETAIDINNGRYI
ncbi:peptidoglycan DD-metalloendopeptidase family protein [Streptomyces rochei]|uniref:peptidoglycan DD-metalloendopeptidase family protein n=1 Tax=Streptomyces rochei TaxID=1928 RepID=UPI0033A868DA